MDLGPSLMVVALFIAQAIPSSGLECFVCTNQEDNYEKCISSVQLCDPELHDVCSTNVRWGVTFFWVPAIKRIHYISKACDNMRNCMDRKRLLESRCYRDWWADWMCEDCCTGDRCNYYVTGDPWPKCLDLDKVLRGPRIRKGLGNFANEEAGLRSKTRRI